SLAARPETAVPLYEQVIRECRERGFQVETGVFAAEMMVDSENDGPVTILLDTNEL
ncbi:MAG: D-aminoacyl-tRNA deacylase, partial [Oscillospiraceae bacterium]|nr:D-aminoacyl-tRNA deacylase [Oscillospiraceae bacterium]